MNVIEETRRLAAQVDAEFEKDWARRGFTHERDRVVLNENRKGKKFLYVDFAQPGTNGGSGAWLVEIATGEIYNIKAYGVPDYNKKAKSNIGNVATVDPARMLRMRFNYLR